MNGLTSEVYAEGEFEKYDKFDSEDLIKGKINNGCNFEMAEVLTKKKSVGENSDNKYQTVFNGLLAKVETPKNFNSCVYLRNDIKDQGFLVRVLSGKYDFDKLRIELDPKEFEKMFDVYSSDKEVVSKLFTLEIKQKLMDFENEMKMKFEITMKNNYMYIRFWSGKMFEVAKLSKEALDQETLYKYYQMLFLVFDLSNKLVEILNKI